MSMNRHIYNLVIYSMCRPLIIPEILALEMTRYLKYEYHYNPWKVGLKHLLYSDTMFRKFLWYPTYRVGFNEDI